MINKKLLVYLFVLVGCFICLPDQIFASQTSHLPSGWNADAHTSLISKVGEIKGFIFSTPVLIGAIFAFAMAVYHTFREGSVMPLLSVIGIIIIASLAPLILDVVQPMSAQGMVLDALNEYEEQNTACRPNNEQ